MDYYNGTQIAAHHGQHRHDTMSLQDMIECDMQSPPLEQQQQQQQQLLVSNGAHDLNSGEQQLTLFRGWPHQNVSNDALSWANNIDMTSFQQMSSDVRNIMVDPQTGLPQSSEPPPPYSLHNFDSPPRTITLQPPPLYSQHRQTNPSSINLALVQSQQRDHKLGEVQKKWDKPAYSYSCLIAMALKNCKTGCLPVSEIYNFMIENFPYFKTAPAGWKNSVRHNLSLNKCFEKIERPVGQGNARKGCLWALNPAKIEKMEEECLKWRKKDPIAIKRAMAHPDRLEALEKGIPQTSDSQDQSSPSHTIVSDLKPDSLGKQHGALTELALFGGDQFEQTFGDVDMKYGVLLQPSGTFWSDPADPGDFSPGQDQAVPSGVQTTSSGNSLVYDAPPAVNGSYIYAQNHYSANNNTKSYTDNSSHNIFLGSKTVSAI